MKMLLTYILLVWLAIANGQSFDSISKNYKTLELKQIDTRIELNSEKTNHAWLNLLPSVNYDIDANSINLGISLSNFSNYYQLKQRNKIELAKLQENLETRLENNLVKLENDYLKLQLEVKLKEVDYKTIANELEYILLKKEQFKHHKLILENWLKIKQVFLQKLNRSIAQVENLLLQVNRFKNKVKYPYRLKIAITLQRLLEIYHDLKLKLDE